METAVINNIGMKLLNIRWFFIVGVVGIVGCSPSKQPVQAPVGTEVPVKLPLTFPSYQAFYAFVARRTYGGMPTDAETLFKLAADSTTEILTLEDKQLPYVHLVTSHYYNGGIYDRIRGAQGNGDYYILRPLAPDYTALDTDRGFELVGIAEGNTWRLRYVTGRPRFVTTWHMSADESPESILEWNGRFFESVK